MVSCEYFQTVVIIFVFMVKLINSSEINKKSDKVLTRKQRFIAFPVGSTFTVSTCLTVGVIGNPNVNYLSLGLNWGVAYELPNITWVLDRAHGISTAKTPVKEAVVKRRDRRDLYQKLEIIMNGVGVVGNPQINYMSYGLNWGIAYDLPNETWIIDHLHGFGSQRQPSSLAVVKRRNRRSLYHSIENLIDRMGYNGRDCVLRALCESRQFFHSQKLGMIPELIRTIFSLPKTRLFTREIEEHSDLKDYNGAYFSDNSEDCEFTYPCEFSLLELAMGGYSQPPPLEDFY